MGESGAGPGWRDIEAVFHDALALAPDQRRALVEARLGQAPEARAEVLRMLAAHQSEASPLDHPALALLAAAGGPRRIGDWRLLRRLGGGGMGEVHLAVRSDGDFEQLAAIKLVDAAPGEDAQFAAERRALAKLRHPHIAQLYDSGRSEDGRHYLVMEYVEGERLDHWLARLRPPLASRLRLFVQACRAVHHAHRNLVVHRDLKPSNVLVLPDAVPKLIDFGIAAPPGGEGEGRLTPAYASPEQLRGEPVTTASDVFALGQVLHELVAGAPAFGIAAMTPTARLEAIAAGPAPLPRRGPDRPSALAGCRGFAIAELDAILRVVLDPKPERRYPSAEALAADVERWLARRPLAARGDGAGYRLRSALARHPWSFAAAVTALLALLGALALLAHQGTRLQQALARAEAQAERAGQAAAFLGGLFTDADPERGQAGTPSAAELLEQGAGRLAELDDADLRAELANTIGRALLNLGELDLAEARFAQVAEVGGEAHRADALQGLAAIAQERGRHAEAEHLQRRALALLGDAEAGPAWRARLRLAAILQSRGQLDEAASQLAGVAGQAVSPDLAAAAHVRLGALAWGRGELVQAESHYREALAGYTAQYGPAHHEVSRAHYALATALHALGRHEQARGEYELALALRRDIYGGSHPRVAEVLAGMAALAYDAGDSRRAAELGREALAMHEAVHGPDSPRLALPHNNLGLALHDLGRFDEAMAHYRRAVSLHRQSLDEGHARVLGTRANLALLALDRGDRVEARAELDPLSALAEARLPAGHPIRAFVDHLAGRAALESGELAKARRQLGSALAARRGQAGGRHPQVADSLYWQAWLEWADGEPAAARERADEALAMREALLDAGDWRVAQSRAQAGALRAAAGDPAGAALRDQGLAALAAVRGAQDWQLARLRRQLDGVAPPPD